MSVIDVKEVLMPRNPVLVVLALCGVLVLAACDQAPPVGPSNVIQTVTVNVGQPAPTGSPSPGASNCVREAIDSVRVGPFGIVCPGGRTPPRNNEGIIPAGCTAIFTATPKDRAGVDVPAALHGSQITWAIPVGSSRVEMADAGGEAFNKNIYARTDVAPGDVQITATVCSHVGTWNGRTIP